MPVTALKKLSFGEFIRKLREDRGWTQEQLQAKSELGAGSISNLENDDTNPKQSTLEKLARAFSYASVGQFQVAFEQFTRGGTDVTETVTADFPRRRASDLGLDPVAVVLAERIMRLPRPARHAIEGVLMAFEEELEDRRVK